MTPKIYLVSHPDFDLVAFQDFLRDEKVEWKRSPGASQGEEIVEAAGRVCYMSFGEKQSPKTNAEYIHRLIQMGHESVLEHVSWSFLLTGVSRAFSHQLVRHRVGFAFSQLSQQYHEEIDAKFIEPPIKLSSSALLAWERAMQTGRESYREILRSLQDLEKEAQSEADRREIRRAIHSTARSVLPNATETKIFVTANARALRYFFVTRGSIPGDLEMRQVAAGMLSAVKREAPTLFSDLEIGALPDGSPIILKHAPG